MLGGVVTDEEIARPLKSQVMAGMMDKDLKAFPSGMAEFEGIIFTGAQADHAHDIYADVVAVLGQFWGGSPSSPIVVGDADHPQCRFHQHTIIQLSDQPKELLSVR
jgi:hypothetical protein